MKRRTLLQTIAAAVATPFVATAAAQTKTASKALLKCVAIHRDITRLTYVITGDQIRDRYGGLDFRRIHSAGIPRIGDTWGRHTIMRCVAIDWECVTFDSDHNHTYEITVTCKLND